MAFSNKITEIINREIYIKDDEGWEENITLIDYINKTCKKKCDIGWDIDAPPECECIVSRFYYAIVKLAEMEHSKEGQEWEKRMRIG